MAQILRLRVILDTEEDVFRDIEIQTDAPLMHLHFAVLDAFGWEAGEMASFFQSDESWSRGQEFPLMDMSDPMAQLRAAASLCAQLKRENSDLTEASKGATSASSKLKDLQAEHAHLRRAHTQQAAYVQSLQDDRAKADAYRTTIGVQERVIAKLEDLVSNALRELAAGRKAELAESVARAGTAYMARFADAERELGTARAPSREVAAKVVEAPVVQRAESECVPKCEVRGRDERVRHIP